MRMRRFLAVMALLVLVFSSSTGCISIYLAKSLFVPEDEDRIQYGGENIVVSHKFVTVITDQNTVDFSNVTTFYVDNTTRYIDMTLKVSIPKLPEITNQSWREIVDEYVDMERYVNVTLYDPEGKVVHTDTVNKTTEHPIQYRRIGNPAKGTWRLRVKATGIGIEALEVYDRFTAKVITSTIRVN